MAAMVRLQAVRGYRELVAELGGDPTRLLRAARIKVSAFEQAASFISFDGMIDLSLGSKSVRGAVARCFRLIDTPSTAHQPAQLAGAA